MTDHDKIPALPKRVGLLCLGAGVVAGRALVELGHTGWGVTFAVTMSVAGGCLLARAMDPYAIFRLPGQHRALAALARSAQASRHLLDPVDGVVLVCRTQRDRHRRILVVSRILRSDVASMLDSGAREAMLPVDVFLLGPHQLVVHLTTAHSVRVDDTGAITDAFDDSDPGLAPTSRQLREVARFAASTGAIFATADHADTLIAQLQRAHEYHR